MTARWGAGVALVVAAATIVGCDEKKALVAPAAPAASKAPEPAKPPPERPIEVTVDAEGTLVGGERAAGAEGARKMRELVARLDLKGKTPMVTALRGAKAGDVTALVAALAAGGASEVAIRTQDRSKRDTIRKMTPDTKAGKLAECTVAVTVQKDRTTASWPIRGGVATRYAKGMAGPDLSMTLEGVKKQVAACTSTAMVLSGDDGVDWGLVFDVSDRVLAEDPPLKITTWVLAREALVAGHAVPTGDGK